jgi:hypothetical protein
MWDSSIHVMCDVCTADAMVQKIKNETIWSVNRHKGSLDPRPLIVVKVWNVHVSMLEPGVQNEPKVYHQVGSEVERKHWEEP